MAADSQLLILRLHTSVSKNNGAVCPPQPLRPTAILTYLLGSLQEGSWHKMHSSSTRHGVLHSDRRNICDEAPWPDHIDSQKYTVRVPRGERCRRPRTRMLLLRGKRFMDLTRMGLSRRSWKSEQLLSAGRNLPYQNRLDGTGWCVQNF